jgi:hypothetical protein
MFYFVVVKAKMFLFLFVKAKMFPFVLLKAINESDVIMCFANRGHQEELQWTQLFWFDTSELPDSDDEEILTAELRMYKEPVANANG